MPLFWKENPNKRHNNKMKNYNRTIKKNMDKQIKLAKKSNFYIDSNKNSYMVIYIY